MTRGLVTAVLAVLLASCSGGGDPAATTPVTTAAPVTLFVVGSGPSAGGGLDDPLREAWPRLVFLEAFSGAPVLVNSASGPSTVTDAIAEQLPLAVEVEPDVTAVWIGSYDMNIGTPPAEFGIRLQALLSGLAPATTERVLVADLPSLPAFDEDLRIAYNSEIAAAAAATGATLVALNDVAVDPVDPGRDYQPNAAGHRVIADAFIAAITAPD